MRDLFADGSRQASLRSDRPAYSKTRSDRFTKQVGDRTQTHLLLLEAWVRSQFATQPDFRSHKPDVGQRPLTAREWFLCVLIIRPQKWDWIPNTYLLVICCDADDISRFSQEGFLAFLNAIWLPQEWAPRVRLGRVLGSLGSTFYPLLSEIFSLWPAARWTGSKRTLAWRLV